jgi:hypothetical protein
VFCAGWQFGVADRAQGHDCIDTVGQRSQSADASRATAVTVNRPVSGSVLGPSDFETQARAALLRFDKHVASVESSGSNVGLSTGSIATAGSIAVAGSIATVASIAVAGSIATTASMAVAGSIATVGSGGIAGSSLTALSLLMRQCVACVACFACRRCVGCLGCARCRDCVGCIGCYNCAGLRNAVGLRDVHA